LKLVAKYLLGYLMAHVLLISMIQSYFCTELKMLELGLILLVFGVAIVNSKKIILDKSDIIICFLLIFLNIYYIFFELRGLIFFKMTYVLALAILISKVILPNISFKKYLSKIDTIYLIILIALVIEYLLLLIFGQVIFIELFNCEGEETGVRGYIPLYNMTKEILPFHITGLNSIMMGGQTASQLSVIIFVWCFYKFKDSEKTKYLALGLLAVIMLILSPSLTSIFLLLISLGIIYLIHLKDFFNRKIKSFYWSYIVLLIAVISIYFMLELLTFKYVSLDIIYEEYILNNLVGFGYFDFKEILFGISVERENELFGVGEIALLNQLMKYGFLGVGIFYGSILYYILRVMRFQNITALTPNIVILFIFILGNSHYPVMFNVGVMELFILHLAYIIYQGMSIKKLK
jgi:hypothetical protein